MALDDFDSTDSEMDLDEDLFDFPEVELELDEDLLAEEEIEEFPADVVEAAAAVQEEIDSQLDESGIFGMDDDDLGDDLDLDDLLGDDDLLGGIAGLDDDGVEDDDAMDFDQLIPKAEPQSAPAPSVPAAAPIEAPAQTFADKEPVAVSAPAEPPPERLIPQAAAGGFSLRSSWPIVAAILLFNIIVLGLGLAAISSVSNSVDTFASKLGEVAREIRDTSPPQVVTVPVVAPVTTTDTAPANTDSETANTTRVKLPPYARGELKAAQDEMDRGEYQIARRRLFRLLATIDDPLSEDAPQAEEQANLLIAETFVLESNNPARSEG